MTAVTALINTVAITIGRPATAHASQPGRLVHTLPSDRVGLSHAVVIGAYAGSVSAPIPGDAPLARVEVNPAVIPLADGADPVENLDFERARLEFTVGRAELPALAPWLAAFVLAREAGDKRMLPPPPFPLSMPHVQSDPYEFTSVWSTLAADHHARHTARPIYRRRRRTTLPTVG